MGITDRIISTCVVNAVPNMENSVIAHERDYAFLLTNEQIDVQLYRGR